MTQESYLPWWQRWLLQAVRMSGEDTLPKHVAFIMDGNRRYAKKLQRHTLVGHTEGARNLSRLCEACVLLGIKYVTVYGFALGNFHRSPEEVHGLLELAEHTFSNSEWINFFVRNRIRFRLLGDLSYLPASLRETLQRAAAETAAGCQRAASGAGLAPPRRSGQRPAAEAAAEVPLGGPQTAAETSCAATLVPDPPRETADSPGEARQMIAAPGGGATPTAGGPAGEGDCCRLLLTVCVAYGSRSEIARSLAPPTPAFARTSITTFHRADSASVSADPAAGSASASSVGPHGEVGGARVGSARTAATSFCNASHTPAAADCASPSSDFAPFPANTASPSIPARPAHPFAFAAAPSPAAAAAARGAAASIVASSTGVALEIQARADSGVRTVCHIPPTVAAAGPADTAAAAWSAKIVSADVVAAAQGDVRCSSLPEKPSTFRSCATTAACAVCTASRGSASPLTAAACGTPVAADALRVAALSSNAPTTAASESHTLVAASNPASSAVGRRSSGSAVSRTVQQICRRDSSSSSPESAFVFPCGEIYVEPSRSYCVRKNIHLRRGESNIQRRSTVRRKASLQREQHVDSVSQAPASCCCCCVCPMSSSSCSSKEQSNASSATGCCSHPCPCWSTPFPHYEDDSCCDSTVLYEPCYYNSCGGDGWRYCSDRCRCCFSNGCCYCRLDGSHRRYHCCCFFSKVGEEAGCAAVGGTSSCLRSVTATRPRAPPHESFFCKELLQLLLEGKDLNVSACGKGQQRKLEQLFWRRLQLGDVPAPDVLVRTSGERRLSDFLLYETSQQTHFYFLPILWPELSPLHVLLTVLHYQIYQVWLAPMCRLTAKAINLFTKVSDSQLPDVSC